MREVISAHQCSSVLISAHQRSSSEVIGEMAISYLNLGSRGGAHLVDGGATLADDGAARVGAHVHPHSVLRPPGRGGADRRVRSTALLHLGKHEADDHLAAVLGAEDLECVVGLAVAWLEQAHAAARTRARGSSSDRSNAPLSR